MLFDSTDTIAVRQSVLDYIQKWVPTCRIGVLAGSSVHADKSFLVEEMPQVVDWLHYRYVNLFASEVAVA
jgi:oligoribonuclease